MKVVLFVKVRRTGKKNVLAYTELLNGATFNSWECWSQKGEGKQDNEKRLKLGGGVGTEDVHF